MPRLKKGAGEKGAGRSTVVVALGGNALQPAAERGEIQQQFAHTRESLESIVALAAEGWDVAIVHGNGPQIGDALLRNERAAPDVPGLPLGVLVAATAGWIGYMIQQSLQNALRRAGIRRDVVTLVTQVVVDPADPATKEPVKPIGRVLDESTAQRLHDEDGWAVGPSGNGWRRLAPSPVPLRIVEAPAIRRLLEAGTIVIAAGGGGTPVYKDPALGLEGVDGVIDKDRAAQVLATELGARALMILTDVDGVYRAWATPAQELLRRLGVAQAESLLAGGELGKGSMAPKLEAAVAFVRAGGERAHIGRLDQGLATLKQQAGTTIVADVDEVSEGTTGDGT